MGNSVENFGQFPKDGLVLRLPYSELTEIAVSDLVMRLVHFLWASQRLGLWHQEVTLASA